MQPGMWVVVFWGQGRGNLAFGIQVCVYLQVLVAWRERLAIALLFAFDS